MFIPFPFCKIKDFVVKSITLYHFGVIKGRRKICIYAIFVNISTVILIFINIMTVFLTYSAFWIKLQGKTAKKKFRRSGRRDFTLYISGRFFYNKRQQDGR